MAGGICAGVLRGMVLVGVRRKLGGRHGAELTNNSSKRRADGAVAGAPLASVIARACALHYNVRLGRTVHAEMEVMSVLLCCCARLMHERKIYPLPSGASSHGCVEDSRARSV